MNRIEKGNFFVELELHSIGPTGEELFTFRHCHERIIHADFMTYRVNRNASSSRAIPYRRMTDWIKRDPAMPLHLGRNIAGMSVGPVVDSPEMARDSILTMLDKSVRTCNVLNDVDNLHKEIINRYLEPWGWINVVSTWNRPQLMNAVAQRCTPEAATNIQRLFISMLRLVKNSEPQRLGFGQWHVPFISDISQSPPDSRCDLPEHVNRMLVWSVARSAWTSLQTVNGRDAAWEDAKRRHDGCVEHKHMTPCEHQKRCVPGRGSGTTPGWEEYRHMIPGQMQLVDIDAVLARYEGRDFITKGD